MRGRVASRGRPSAPEHGIHETGTPGNTYGRSGILSGHWQCFPPPLLWTNLAYFPIGFEMPFLPGVGVFITKSGALLKMQGGVTLEAIDGKPRVGVHIGFPF